VIVGRGEEWHVEEGGWEWGETEEVLTFPLPTALIHTVFRSTRALCPDRHRPALLHKRSDPWQYSPSHQRG